MKRLTAFDLDGKLQTASTMEYYMHEFKLKRLGLLMESELGNPHEVGGVPQPSEVVL